MKIDTAGTVLTLTDLHMVCEKLKNASPMWFFLGLALGVSHTDLTNLESQKHDNPSRLREMLAIRMNSGPLTWTDLCIALRASTVNCYNVATEVEKFLQAKGEEYLDYL